MGPYINRAPIQHSRATRWTTACSELRWKAHVFYLGENRHAPKLILLFWFHYNSPNGYAHSNCTKILCKGVRSIRQVIVPLSRPIAMRHHR